MTRRLQKMGSGVWLAAAYAGTAVPMFALWEVAQLPLYTIWHEQSTAENFVAAMHCTVGDAVIAFATLMASLIAAVLVPGLRRVSVIAAMTVLFGILATGVIEILSTQVLARWAYAPAMPILPLFGIGLSPVLQWLVIPAVALLIMRSRLLRWTAPHVLTQAAPLMGEQVR